MEAFIILSKLLCAHLCSDFILQTKGVNDGKNLPGIKGAGYQLLHSFIHAASAYLFVAEWSLWLIPIVIFAGHLLIDLTKCNFFNEKSVCVFLIDQLCHLAVITGLWYILYGDDIHLSFFDSCRSVSIWVTVTAYVLVLNPSSILLSLFLQKWTPAATNTKSLPNAGRWIGCIERLLILSFVLTDNFEGIGFLLAAKSVFRFGDLNKTKDIQTTEYVLIGTLASFTVAILIGLAVSFIRAILPV